MQKINKTAINDWQNTPWIMDFAAFYNMPVCDVKLVYEIFLGDRVNLWPHPFGDISPWVYEWKTEKTKTIRDKLMQDKGWSWDSAGAKVLQNEIYRRTPESLHGYKGLRKILIDYRQQINRSISLLDYGCGSANFVDCIVDLQDVYFSLMETDPMVVSYCTHKFRFKKNVLSCEVIQSPDVYSGDACRVRTLPIEHDKSYDVIYLMDVLEHTLDPLNILINLNRHLKKDGLLIFNYPDNIEGDWHTPEAHYLRPFCIYYINYLFTQVGPLVFRKTCSCQAENRANRIARFFSFIGIPLINKKALSYLKNSTYADKYNLR